MILEDEGYNVTNFDDLTPANETGKSLSENTLQGLEAYEAYKVNEKRVLIEKESKNLVKSLLKVYFDTDLIDNNEHVSAIEAIETSNLIGLIESSRYAQHAVTSLMRKIDAGLHTDLQVYAILIELQKSALEIQMKVAQYSRTLSPYLKSLKEDMDEQNNSTIDILSRVEDTKIVDEQLGEENFRGGLALNKFFEEKMERIRKSKEERKRKVDKEMNEIKDNPLDGVEDIEFEEVIEDEIIEENEDVGFEIEEEIEFEDENGDAY